MPCVEYDVAAAIQDAHRAGLVDALLQDLAVLVLAVGHQLVGVLPACRAGRRGE